MLLQIGKAPSYEGIPVLLRFHTIDLELSKYPDEKKAVELAKTLGWRKALELVYGQGMVAYSSDPRRSRFLDLLPLTSDMVVLEIGVGFGQHTAEIASRVKHLDTLELRLLNSLFTKLRCEQTGATNVTFACGGDDCSLPFSDGLYDAVILDLVLEWCGSANPGVPALKSQQKLLSEIHRVLKPNGFLQLSTKNRFAYRLLVGGRDEHAYELPFGSALPRWMLKLILKLKGKASSSGYLHSYGALAKLLRSAGLSPEASYWAVPEMRFAEQYIPTDAQSIRAARPTLTRQSSTKTTEILMRATPARLVRYFTPGLFFLARKR